MMQSDYVIRKASTDDVRQIVELWKELMDFNKERDRLFSRSATADKTFADFIKGHISSDTSRVFVAEVGNEIIGYCLAVLERYPPVLEIQEYGLVQNLVVTKKYRRRDVGRRLFEEAKSFFKEEGLQRIEARAAIHNKLSTGFWAKMGFRPYLETVFLEI